MALINRIKYCKDHNIYYLPKHRKRHLKCLETWELQWEEVVYYLNKYRELKDLSERLRLTLGW